MSFEQTHISGCFDEIRVAGKGFRVVPSSTIQQLHPQPFNASTASFNSATLLPITDRIMGDTFWVGVYPGMTEEMIGYMVETIKGIAK